MGMIFQQMVMFRKSNFIIVSIVIDDEVFYNIMNNLEG